MDCFSISHCEKLGVSTVCFLKSFSAICSFAASFFENVKHVTVEKKNIRVRIFYFPCEVEYPTLN